MKVKRVTQPKTGKGTPVPNPIENTGTQIDDQVRGDSGKPTDDKPVPKEEMEKIQKNARDHTKDEPGS